jgi:hypothetical protein
MKSTRSPWRVLAAFLGIVAGAGFLWGGQGQGTEVTLDGLKSRTPANWKAQRPANKFRAYQFMVPRAEGDKKDAELVIFYFGPGGGGTVADNIKRWKSQFKAPAGKSIDDVARVEKKIVSGVQATYLDIHGTYLFKFPPFDPNAEVKPLPNYRRLGVYFGSKNGPYFITLTGPAKTIAENKKGFDDWLMNFK